MIAIITISFPASNGSGKFINGNTVTDEHDSSDDTGSDGETHKTSKLLKKRHKKSFCQQKICLVVSQSIN